MYQLNSHCHAEKHKPQVWSLLKIVKVYRFRLYAIIQIFWNIVQFWSLIVTFLYVIYLQHAKKEIVLKALHKPAL